MKEVAEEFKPLAVWYAICNLPRSIKTIKELSEPLNEENKYFIGGFNHLRNQNTYRNIRGQINIDSTRNKFESLI